MNYIIKYEDQNIIKISKEVIISIISTIIKENNNLVSINNDVFSIIRSFFQKNINIIKLDVNNIIAKIYINIYYGNNIYKTVEFIQKSIINSIESMTGIKNIQIDVIICKIIFIKKNVN